jgi:hypothetical protein
MTLTMTLEFSFRDGGTVAHPRDMSNLRKFFNPQRTRYAGTVAERWIRGSALAGLASVGLGAYAYSYRAISLCTVPEGCDIPGTGNHHPYTTVGVTLLVVGCAALCLAVITRRRSAR